jgi:hypothetical protein
MGPGLYRNMIDNLSILLSHVLIAIAFWYLTLRDDLDLEDPPAPDTEPEGFGHALRNRKRPTAKDAAKDKASGDA